PYKGFTNKKSEFSFELGMPAKQVLFDVSAVTEDGKISFWADCGTNDLFGNLNDGILTRMDICVCDDEIRTLYYDLEVLCNLYEKVTHDETLKKEIEMAFDIAKNDISSARKITSTLLSQKSDDDFIVTGIGHAHIDLAWLWPIRETKRKAARTFSTLMRNVSLYDDYIFGASQPQLLSWIKCEYPCLYDQLLELNKRGRFEPQGIFWVECDTNIPCGESLVRQALYGKRFFKDEFDINEEICWIPDVFGYSAQLPQIIKKSGGKYFLTTKMSWNSVNKFPYSSFVWQGIDGSEVLAHLPPEGNYNSPASPWAINNIKTGFNEKGLSNEAVLLFGIGDGGGGPGMEHLERLKREKSLKGLPQVRQEKIIDFFKRLEICACNLPKWRGELYLEKHQGTYTTHAKNKLMNRLLETQLHDCELHCLMSERFLKIEYPQNSLEIAWKEVLLYQFHDILPGSAIKRVYNETDVRYNEIAKNIAKLQKTGNTFFNDTSFYRDEYLYDISNQNNIVHVTAPPYGAAIICNCDYTAKATKTSLENDFLLIIFNDDGSINDIYDKETNVHTLRTNANIYTVYEDKENAWEVPDDYLKQPYQVFKIVKIEVMRAIGPIVEIVQHYVLNNSVLTVKINMYANKKRVDFACVLDWQEDFSMLRTAFPLNVNADKATCEIQFGNIERPTHTNTSWDKAKKEVCAHKWVDISEKSYGFALLNNCKYGYRVWNNTIDINLMRQTTSPRENTDTDKGITAFTYAVFPHIGGYENGVVREAYELNYPIIQNSAEYPFEGSLFKTDSENIVIETIKKSENGD
ncbi:MAG: glycoside hydrolase family 38 C-terminal domain-containing protein, partial [Clostridia bacterium]